MENGYYWYRTNYRDLTWHICKVRGNLVYFFGEISQDMDGDYVKQHIEFGEKIEQPDFSGISLDSN